jgi:hypothetical protein
LSSSSFFKKAFATSVSLLFLACLFSIQGCQINEPNLPSWDVDLSLPISDEQYDIFDIIERSNNIGIDSSDGNTVFVYGTSSYKREFGEDIKFDGISTTQVKAPSSFSLDTALVFDDSTFVQRADFLNGVLKFTFNNITSQDYTVRATIKNLFRNESNDTVRILEQVAAGQKRPVTLDLSQHYLKNETSDNKLRLKIIFESVQPVLVDFTYELSEYSIKTLVGRMRPLSTDRNYDEVLDPFGSDVPEGSVNFASITPNTNFLVLRRYSSNYQVDFSDISLVGENKDGSRIRLKYLKYGNPGDPIDTIFSLKLPQSQDSLAFPINQDNSNILEFINNIPKKIVLERTDYLNLSYEEGHLGYTDSLTIRFEIQVPLDVSITKPILFTDTSDVGIDDTDLREEMDKIGKMKLNLRGINGIPLKGVMKATLYDSSYNELLPLTFIVGNTPDSSVTVGAASVGMEGYTTNPRESIFTAELDSLQIQKLKRMGKIIFEYKLYTDPDQIVPPRTTVKVRSSDVTHALIFGNLKYRIDP